MTSLEISVQKLVIELTKANCFGPDGSVHDAKAVHRILDVPFLHVTMLDLVTSTFCYSNSKVASKAKITPGWIPEHEIYGVGLVFDPMSFQRVLSEMDRYSQGGQQASSGVITLISEDGEEEEQTFCTDLSALVARSEDGKNTYFAHFFCEMDNMDLLNAYAAFDLNGITTRQLETLDNLLKGGSYQSIADSMEITYKTLEKHVHAVYELTNCQNQAALIAACNTV